MSWKIFTRTTGIYRIINKQTKERYIGMSKDIGERWKSHLYLLKNNKHHCKKLQESWNLYGYENFSFEVVEVCKKTELVQKEIFHWEQEQELCFNGKPDGTDKEVTDETKQKLSQVKKGNQNAKGKTHSEETKKQISETLKGKTKGRQHTEETKSKISQSIKGNQYAKGKPKSEEHKRKIGEASRKYWAERNKEKV